LRAFLFEEHPQMVRTPITKEGYNRLKKELEHLEKIERPAVIQAIAEARGHGDLSENAEYHAAKERQGHIESRIQHLNKILANSEVIDCTNIPCDKVIFGVRVKLINLDTDEEVVYQLVGPEESNIQESRISISSPLGRALIGKTKGDEIEFRSPSGIKNYELMDIFI
jgi:transcription elongation factor GreA